MKAIIKSLKIYHFFLYAGFCMTLRGTQSKTRPTLSLEQALRNTTSLFLYLFFCFLSLLLWPLYLAPGNTHVECLLPLVANQQQIKKFPYALHTSFFSEPKILWAKAAKLQTHTKANQQRASSVNKIKLV